MQGTANISFGRLVVEFQLDNTTLRPGPAAHRLDLNIQTRALWLVDTKDDPTANVSVLLQGFVGVGPSMPLAVLAPRVFNIRGYSLTELLTVMLSDEQLVALEARRGQDGVTLHFDLEAVLLGVSQPLPARAPFTFRIGGPEWLQMLEGVGLGIGITIRVPTPLSDPGAVGVNPLTPAVSAFSQAGLRLREARQFLREGRYEQCVQTCRKVLEAVRGVTPMPSQSQVGAVQAQDRPQAARWAALYYDLFSLASAAMHEDELTKSFTWDRADADAMLAATAGVLARAISHEGERPRTPV